MSLYNLLKQNKSAKAKANSSEEELHKALEMYGNDLPNLSERVNKIGVELKKVKDSKLQERRIQIHRIEDYWNQEQITEYDRVLEIVGVEIPRDSVHYESPNERYLDAVKSGLLFKWKDNVYVASQIGKRIKEAVGAVSFFTCGVGGIGYVAAKTVKKTHGMGKGPTAEEFAIFFGLCAAAFTGLVMAGHVLENAKNPFETVALQLEERTKYILERLK